MNKDIITIDIDTTIASASKIMSKKNIGFLPVLNKGNLSGIITDRDIINRIVSKEKDIYASVFIAMTTNVITVRKNDDISIAISKMADNQIRRILVLNNKNELVGILSLADIANHKKSREYLPELIYEILLPEITDLFLTKNTEVLI